MDLGVAVKIGFNVSGIPAVQAGSAEIEKLQRQNAVMAQAAQGPKVYAESLRKLDDELRNFISTANPAYRAQQQLDHGNDLLARGLQAGLINQQTYNETLSTLSARYKTASVAAEEMAKATERGAFATVQARREMVVLAHEAVTGNFSRMPGSFMVLAERMNLSTAALLGMGGVLIATAAGVAILVAAVASGAAEMDKMNRALESTANFAGQTRGTMRELAMVMSETGKVTVGQAKDIVTELAASGQIGAQAFGSVARLAVDYARQIGKSANEATPELVKLFSDPTKGAEELNRTMHFLTVAEMEYIRQLQETGHYTEAQQVLAEKLSGQLSKQTENLGLVEKAWRSMKDAASSAWDAMLGLGRESTVEEKLAKLKQEIQQAALGGNNQRAIALAGEYAALQAQLDAQSTKLEAQNAQAERNRKNQESFELIRSKSDAYRKDELRRQLEEIRGFNPENASQAAYKADAIKQIREELAGGAKAINEYQSALNQLGGQKAKLEFEIGQFAKYGTAAHSAQGALMEFETTKGKLAGLSDAKKDNLLTVAGQVDRLAESKHADEEFAAYQKHLNEQALHDEQAYQKQRQETVIHATQQLAQESQRINGSLIRDDKARAYAQLDLEKKKWLDIISLTKVGTEERKAIEESYAEWLASRTAEIAKQTRTPMQKMLEDWQDATRQMQQASADWLNNGVEMLVTFAKTGKFEFGKFAESVLTDLLRIQMRKAAAGMFSMMGFADGGIMSSSGPVPLRAYASGGIASSPQLALFGEGSMNEAYVPLPDGRRIPVKLEGQAAGAPGNTYNVSVAVDASGSRVQGDAANATDLGRRIEGAVRRVLVDEKRPGGLLA